MKKRYAPNFQQLLCRHPDYSKIMLVTILFFQNYSLKFGDLLFSKLCRYNEVWAYRCRPTACHGKGVIQYNALL